MRIAHILLLILLCSNFIQAQTTPPKYETRAVWLTTIGGIDWPHSYAQSAESIKKQKKELTDILDRLQKANINTVLLQTRVRGTVIYPSLYEPWDGCMSGHPGKSPGYDPLSFAISECHRRGMDSDHTCGQMGRRGMPQPQKDHAWQPHEDKRLRIYAPRERADGRLPVKDMQ